MTLPKHEVPIFSSFSLFPNYATVLCVFHLHTGSGHTGLSKMNVYVYAPPAGSGFISRFTSISCRSIDMNSPNQAVPFEPSSYLFAQSMFDMAQEILDFQQGLKKMHKKNQVVILLDPERQPMRREGEVPVAIFLWYSAARPCSRNCYDHDEIARVMNAAGRRRDSLPQDLQTGLDLGIISPEVLENFFDLDQYPVLKELAHNIINPALITSYVSKSTVPDHCWSN